MSAKGGNDPELERQRAYIRQLEQEIESLKRQLESRTAASKHSAGIQKTDDVQERILQELNYLKGNDEALRKPGTGS